MLGKDWKVVKTPCGNRRIYTRSCDLCQKYYEGRGNRFCSKSCSAKWNRKNKDYSNAAFKKGKANPNSGGLSQERKRSLSEQMKKRWACGAIISKTFRPKETKLEIAVREVLQELGLNFKRNFWINIGGYSTKEFDFYISDLNLLIEVDGEYWHSLPKNIENDKYKDKLAKIAGYDLLRIPEKVVVAKAVKAAIADFRSKHETIR